MHYNTTGPEILNDIDVDVFVAGVGTGGTISGLFLKNIARFYRLLLNLKIHLLFQVGIPDLI